MERVMKIVSMIVLLLLLSFPITSYALGGWKQVGKTSGKLTLEALRHSACLWVNTSKNGKVTRRYQVISKKKGERIIVYQNQRVSKC